MIKHLNQWKRERNTVWFGMTIVRRLGTSFSLSLSTSVQTFFSETKDSTQLITWRAAAAFYITSSHDLDYFKAVKSSRHRVSLRNVEDGLAYDSAKFFKRMTPCQCLKQIYLRERSKPRISFCSFCRSEKERRQLYLCADCLYHQYCNVECQADHWPRHKRSCRSFSPLVNTWRLTVMSVVSSRYYWVVLAFQTKQISS